MSDDLRALMTKMVQSFDTGDTSAVETFVNAAYRDHQGLGDGEVHGPEGFRRVVETARSALNELRVSIDDLLVDGDRAAARLRWTGVRQTDGATITRETIDIVRFENGQAAEHWGFRTWVDSA